MTRIKQILLEVSVLNDPRLPMSPQIRSLCPCANRAMAEGTSFKDAATGVTMLGTSFGAGEVVRFAPKPSKV